MAYKESLGSKVFDVFNYIFLSFICIIMIYPFLNVIALSISSPDFINMGTVTFFPKGFNFEGYKLILSDPQVLTGYKNTILYASVGTFFTLMFTSLMAYPLTIADFKAKKFLTIYLTITMFFGGGMIPTYLLVRSLHMIDTFWVMVIPGCVGAFNVFMFRTFFQAIPGEMRESAFLDGANDIVILFRIILPLSKALLATFALFTIVGHWNGWFNALIYLKDEKHYPIQMLLRRYLMSSLEDTTGQMNMEMAMSLKRMKVHSKNIQMAVTVVTMLPITMLYPFLQKYFVKGVMLGSIKG